MAAAKAFLEKVIKHQGQPAKTVTLDGSAASHRAVREMKEDGVLPEHTKVRSAKYLNNQVEQRGDVCLRALLIHGAQSVLARTKEPGPWIEQLRRRGPDNVVTVALANKLARTIWALLAHDRKYLLANHPPTPTADGRRSISKVIDRGIRRFFDGNAAAFCEHWRIEVQPPILA